MRWGGRGDDGGGLAWKRVRRHARESPERGAVMAGGWSLEDAKADALRQHPDCTYADVVNGLDMLFNTTWVVKLWRNEDCYLAGDPPRHEVNGPYYTSDRVRMLVR
jgi:hypothetical protein